MKRYAVGTDIGGTSIKLGLFSADGILQEKWETKTRKEDGGAHILEDAAHSIRQHLNRQGIERQALLGVGVGVPGAVTKGSIVNRCVNLGWGVKNVAQELSSLLDGVSVTVGNDANVAALGEMWRGGGQGYENLVMITLGTGVGGGIIVGGHILPGRFGAAGEIGHMCMNPEEEAVCGCGKNGHLEQYASATGITRMASLYLESHPEQKTALRTIPQPTAKDVFDAARSGDEAGLQLAEHLGDVLGRAMAAAACVLDPDIFVIGGGVSNAGQILLDIVGKYYRHYAFHASEGTPIVLARLGNDAGIYGAVKQVLQ